MDLHVIAWSCMLANVAQDEEVNIGRLLSE